ncbi:hypothetical protein RclHR1_22180002 [Rhizophagus clarus]|uniref:Uncharacterized protein n=1 Tax=Rhizophagus clarus TaxID=94130 RepID=A0A2Z6QUP4_9GLOM|nr:hypothetical protein RclHR1_22180002 [Rhizophagus clarus]
MIDHINTIQDEASDILVLGKRDNLRQLKSDLGVGDNPGNEGLTKSPHENQEDEQTNLSKRAKIYDHTPSPCEPPHTPPHRIFSCGSASVPSQVQGWQELSDLDSTCSNYEIDVENTYLQLSQENSQIVPEEICKIIEKMEGIKYRLFDYRIINLSERNVTNPVNKLSKSEKRILKDIWNSLEPKPSVKTIRLDKWEKVLIPLIQKYQTHL